MLLLSVDSSAVTASAALTENGNIIKSEFLNKIIKAGVKNFEPLIITTNALIILRSSHQLQLQHLK